MIRVNLLLYSIGNPCFPFLYTYWPKRSRESLNCYDDSFRNEGNYVFPESWVPIESSEDVQSMNSCRLGWWSGGGSSGGGLQLCCFLSPASLCSSSGGCSCSLRWSRALSSNSQQRLHGRLETHTFSVGWLCSENGLWKECKWTSDFHQTG